MRLFKHYILFLSGVAVSVLLSITYSRVQRTLTPTPTPTFAMHARNTYTVWHTAENRRALDLSQKVRVLCWVMTQPQHLESRTQHVRDTWGKRCNIILYMSSKESDFPTVGLNVSEGRSQLYWKTIRAFQHIHKHHLDDADWFLKADDDTFVVLENLRYGLSKHNTEEPLFFGRRFTPFVKQGYMSGGAGYVLSKEALRRFVKGFAEGLCTHNTELEDTGLGQCMETMKVRTGDSRDVMRRQTFHPYPPDYYLPRQLPRRRPWYLLYEHYNPVEVRRRCFRVNQYTKQLLP
ncbi:unnamed protein product [Leuciscus chuanchicus]